MLSDELTILFGLLSSGGLLVSARAAYTNARDVFSGSSNIVRRACAELELTPHHDTQLAADGFVRSVHARLSLEHADPSAPPRLDVTLDLAGKTCPLVEVRLLRQPHPHVQHDPDRVLTHDGDFDNTYSARGPAAETCATLNKETRQQLLALVAPSLPAPWDNVTLNKATLRAQILMSDDVALTANRLARLIEDLARAAEAMFCSPDDLPDRLANELGKIQSNLYRAACVTHLLERWPSHPRTTQSLDACKTHAVCELEHLYFTLRPDTFDDEQICRLLLRVSSTHGDPTIRATALDRLAREYGELLLLADHVPLFQRVQLLAPCRALMPRETFDAILIALFPSLREHERREFYKELERLEHTDCFDLLDAETRRAHMTYPTSRLLLELIMTCPDAHRELLLLSLFEHQRDHRIKLKILSHLLELGGKDALIALRAFSSNVDEDTPNDLAKLLARAIESIHSRVKKTHIGALTLSTRSTTSGAISITHQRGALTTTPSATREE